MHPPPYEVLSFEMQRGRLKPLVQHGLGGQRGQRFVLHRGCAGCEKNEVAARHHARNSQDSDFHDWLWLRTPESCSWPLLQECQCARHNRCDTCDSGNHLHSCLKAESCCCQCGAPGSRTQARPHPLRSPAGGSEQGCCWVRIRARRQRENSSKTSPMQLQSASSRCGRNHGSHVAKATAVLEEL